MTVIDVKNRAIRLGADPDIYKRAARNFAIIASRLLLSRQDDSPASVLSRMSHDEVVAYVRYNEYDKKYPKVFDRNGFIKD